MNSVKKNRTTNVKRKVAETSFKPQFNLKNEISSSDDFCVASIVDAAFGKLKPKAFAFPKGVKIELSH